MVRTRAAKEPMETEPTPTGELPQPLDEEVSPIPPPVEPTKMDEGLVVESQPKTKVKTVTTFVRRAKTDGTKIELASVSKLTPAERLALRTSKFKTTVSSSAKLTLRAQKFGKILPEAKQAFGPEILKQRAERFASLAPVVTTKSKD